jgi:gentisate 1,2-dioxygenase
MRMTLSEVMETCKDWEYFCKKTGFSVYAVSEGGGNVEVSMTTLEAHDYGIVKLPEWKVGN